MTDNAFAVKYKWKCFISDDLEKKLNIFFQKNPLFLAHYAHFCEKQNVPLNSVPINVFLKKLQPSIIVPKFEEVMSGFQAILVSEARMHTCLEQAYHQTLHASYHSDSEINFLSVN